MNRKRFSPTVEADVLAKCRRRCALCFGIRGDTRPEKGQLAHVNRNPKNAAPENAAFLCTLHHDEYDSSSRQTKGYPPEELKLYRRELLDYLASPGAWPDASGSISHGKSVKGVASLEVYDRRFPIYRTATQFIRSVLKNLQPELKDILQLAADTDEALFLFDDKIAEYLALLFRKALRLHAISLMQSKLPADDRTANLMDEETALALWFSEQFEQIRTRFAPFLRLV